MKVLIVNRYMGLYGGAETVVRELAQRLQASGTGVRIVTLNISPQVRQLCQGLDIVVPRRQFPYVFRSAGLFSAAGIVREIAGLRLLVKRSCADVDLIHAHNFPAEWVCGGLNKPVVWMCNEVPDFYNSPRLSLILRCARRAGIGIDRWLACRSVEEIVAADSHNAGLVFKRYGRVPKIIPYGIEHDFFSQVKEESQKETLARFGLEKSGFVLQVGMISPEKNQMKSIQALEAVSEAFPQIKLVLAGRPQEPYGSMLRDYCRSKGLQEKVVFTGQLEKAQVRDLYQACQTAFFPVKSQGGWLAPFEALSAGAPVIVSTTMGASDLIGRQGLAIVSDDLGSALRQVLDSPVRFREQAERSAEWVSAHLTWDNFTRKHSELFEHVVRRWRKA